jgi:hypothetical protein
MGEGGDILRRVGGLKSHRLLMPAISTMRRKKPSKLLAVHSRFGESLTRLKLLSGPIRRDSMVKDGGAVGPVDLAAHLHHAYALDAALLHVADAHVADAALTLVLRGQSAMVVLELGEGQRGPMRLRLVAHHRAGGADLAGAAVIDDVVARLLAPAFDRERDRLLRGSALREEQQRKERDGPHQNVLFSRG